jgi:hypothetical protein
MTEEQLLKDLRRAKRAFSRRQAFSQATHTIEIEVGDLVHLEKTRYRAPVTMRFGGKVYTGTVGTRTPKMTNVGTMWDRMKTTEPYEAIKKMVKEVFREQARRQGLL